MLEFLSRNWLWILLIGGMAFMHLSHGSHGGGGHGGHGGSGAGGHGAGCGAHTGAEQTGDHDLHAHAADGDPAGAGTSKSA